MAQVLRIATYNIHKCRGMDGRVRPDRIVAVLRDLDADVVAMQEVVALDGGRSFEDQGRYIAKQLGYEYFFGRARNLGAADYGNAILSRVPVTGAENHDISGGRRERRSCMRVDIKIGRRHIHLFNVHMGTGFLERRIQSRRLLSADILKNPELQHCRILVGDFNEWTRGLTSRLLAAEMESVDLKLFMRKPKTYPGIWPVLHLDHVYFDKSLSLETVMLHRSRAAMMASDHLPLLAQFRLEPEPK